MDFYIYRIIYIYIYENDHCFENRHKRNSVSESEKRDSGKEMWERGWEMEDKEWEKAKRKKANKVNMDKEVGISKSKNFTVSLLDGKGWTWEQRRELLWKHWGTLIEQTGVPYCVVTKLLLLSLLSGTSDGGSF